MRDLESELPRQGPITSSSKLAIEHWNKTPLLISEEERYSTYPWLYEVAEFARHIGERVLEVGCGTGCDLLQFAKNGAYATGIDVTPEHVRLARQRMGQLADVREADATKLPFADGSFDYVYSHGVLHHIEDPRRVVDEIFRVLRAGGRFNVHVYALWSHFTLSRILKYGRNWKLWFENSRDPVHVDLYTGRVLRRLFKPAMITVQKYECRPAPFLAKVLGFFIVVKGQRP